MHLTKRILECGEFSLGAAAYNPTAKMVQSGLLDCQWTGASKKLFTIDSSQSERCITPR